MFIGNKKCRIYAACGVSQTPNVYDKKRIEIVFSFDDVLMKAIEKYQKGVKEA